MPIHVSVSPTSTRPAQRCVRTFGGTSMTCTLPPTSMRMRSTWTKRAWETVTSPHTACSRGPTAWPRADRGIHTRVELVSRHFVRCLRRDPVAEMQFGDLAIAVAARVVIGQPDDLNAGRRLRGDALQVRQRRV